jgi:D-glycero-alpha-D-manno-heptose-7-phosphate kinase
MRLPLGGGGTDLPSYYSRHGGYLITAALNKYVYIVINRRFEDSIRISYSKTEIVDRVEEIEHPIVRESLRLLNVGPGLEIVSIADVPANTGLGSSSSFTVGLLHALHTLKREPVSPQQLAEEAFHVEVEVLKEPIGKQDQYAAAYGGVICLDIQRDGGVAVAPLVLDQRAEEDLLNSTFLFYTGIQRRASAVLAQQGESLTVDEGVAIASMHRIKEIGLRVKEALEDGDLPLFGRLLDEHWQAKTRMSGQVSSSRIDDWYALAKAHGALGGKIVGAGGGGFLMVSGDHGNRNRLRDALRQAGLKELRFAIDHEGSKVVGNF